MDAKALTIMFYRDDINTENNMRTVGRASGSVDKASDSQLTSASSNLERCKYSVITKVRVLLKIELGLIINNFNCN